MAKQEATFPRKQLFDGSDNPKYVDLLEEDRPIAGQKYACVSFVSPENIILKKEHFYFYQFLKHWDFTKSVDKFRAFLHFISFKYNLDFNETVNPDFQEYMKSEGTEFTQTSIVDDYKNFLDAKESELDEAFTKSQKFRTSTRGLKIRGVYPTQQEAELRCRMLREIDPNHDVYVGPVGLWMPWDPEAYKTGRVEYLEDELNQLMHEKKKNEASAKQEFQKRIADSKRKAIEENQKLAKESGNKLTQTLDAQGNLVGVANMSTVESNLGTGTITSADIRRELFEGEGIRTKRDDKEMSIQITERTPQDETTEDAKTSDTGDAADTEN